MAIPKAGEEISVQCRTRWRKKEPHTNVFTVMPRVVITVPEKNAQPYRFQLDRKVVSLGRGSENDIAIDCGSVSVRHAEMCRVEGGYEIRDVGSTNGTKLDGVRRDVIPLRSGMVVKLGDVGFEFSLSDEELEVLGRERPLEESPIVREPEIGLPALPELPDLSEEEPRAPRRAASVPAGTSSGGMGFGSILVFLILAAAAFFAGLSVRYQKENGGSLWDAMQSKNSAPAAPAADPER